jgi:hypothetical protein
MSINSNILTKKTPKFFTCENCDFNTSNKKDFNRHLQTAKHLSNAFQSKIITNSQIAQKNPYECACGKKYKDNSGLWRHKKKCSNDQKEKEKEKEKETETEALIQYLMKENSEFKQLILDQSKQMIEMAKNAGNNNNNTTNNNSFNLNLFLNETCKNALNIMDFVNQLQVGIKDLEETGRLGFSDGVSKIFINGLKELDVSLRPVHCSDLKRETLYIKNGDQWNKENEDKTILTNAIKHVAHKNMKQIPTWQKENPEYNNPDSKQNDKYMKLIYNSMSGSTIEEQQQNINKVIKNVTKEVVIDKK